MNVQRRAPMTKAEFYRWLDRAPREGRYELVEGRVVMMVGTSVGHNILCNNLGDLLRAGLDRTTWLVFHADFGVEVARGIRYPDIVVLPRTMDRAARATREPRLVAEVLSPTSVYDDLNAKVRDYTALPSLVAYLVLSQDEPRAWVWRRGEDGAFPEEPEMIEGAGETIALPALGLTLPMAELYRGVTEGGPQP